jgi:hypothetical protein
MGVIIGIFVGMLLLALYLDNYFLMGHYTRIAFRVLISAPLVPFLWLYNIIYALPHDRKCIRFLKGRGWVQSNTICGPRQWKNPQLWSHPKKGEKWFDDAYELETVVKTRMRGLVFRFGKD